ncbi:MAG: hypothetical protein GQF41_1482 [Candidatus Rifleibacterium amylolyticum]|nr:MAG: hypothetical protein GQF41_1482 [Candidatus Rifleibacterium amylolyticum]NLF97402.1 tetratricopeptide repeat protein [Candidatus Riflebacteria bacterium]
MQKVCYSLLILSVCLLWQLTGCCGQKTLPPPGRSESASKQPVTTIASGSADSSTVERPLEMLDKTGLNYSIDQAGQTPGDKKKSAAGSFFEKQYMQGVELMEKGEYSEAITLFDELVKRYPNTEEASIAELCIAELYFRNKSNDMALQIYQRIVEKYPHSHAAENARAGIEYLQSFDRFADEHVSPEIEARKRRGH